MNKLVARNIQIAFDQKIILDNVSLEVHPGETVVFIGPSGSGKTVLLKALAGIIAPTKGTVTIDGENWQDLDSDHKHALAAKLGMLFQQGGLFDTLTARENVEFPLREHHQFDDEDQLRAKARELLQQVNLLEAQEKIPSELSGGMQRRLGIARALALNPEIIYYDDPVAGQDPMQSDQMLNLINKFKAQNNSTVLMVTSSMRAAFKMADRIFMVIDGGVFETGSIEDTQRHSDARVQQFINGRIEGPIKRL